MFLNYRFSDCDDVWSFLFASWSTTWKTLHCSMWRIDFSCIKQIEFIANIDFDKQSKFDTWSHRLVVEDKFKGQHDYRFRLIKVRNYLFSIKCNLKCLCSSVREILGYSGNEMMGNWFGRYIPREDLAKFEDIRQRCCKSIVFTMKIYWSLFFFFCWFVSSRTITDECLWSIRYLCKSWTKSFDIFMSNSTNAWATSENNQISCCCSINWVR